jgi:hypothetical protein
MNIKKTYIPLVLFFYSCNGLSVELDIRSNSFHGRDTPELFNKAVQQSSYRRDIRDIRQTITHIRNSKINSQFIGKSKFEISNKCNSSAADVSCGTSEFSPTGNINSYIDEYNMYAVIGTGIKLPEEQIESYNGIDD